jgi:hypothetical protein
MPPEHDAFERVTLATAIGGVVILCIYSALTGYQAYIAKDTAQRQLRAYISVNIEKHPDLDNSNPPEVVVLFKNSGQTPAYNVDARLVVYVAGETLTEDNMSKVRSALDELKKSVSVLFPSQEFREASVPGVGIPLTQEDKTLISMGAKTLWVVGRATYTDAFGYTRFTHFRLYMSGAPDTRYHKFIWTADGNDAN